MATAIKPIKNMISTFQVLGGDVIKLVFIALSVQLGFSFIQPVMQYYIEALENPSIPPPETRESVRFTASVIWFVAFNVAAFMLLRSPFAPIFGRLSDRYGRKRLIILGLFLYVLVGIALGLATHPIHIVLIRGFQGILSAMVWPVAEALMMDNVDYSYRTRAMTLYVMSLNFANLIGPGLGGLAYDIYLKILEPRYAINILRPTILTPVPLFLGAAILSLTVREARHNIKGLTGDEAGYKEVLEIPSHVISKSLKAIYTSGLINGFGVGLIASLMIVYISEYIVKEPLYIGLLTLSANSVGLTLAYPIASYTDRKWGKKNMVLFAFTMRTIAFTILIFARDIFSVFLALAIGNISFNTGMPSIRAIQGDLTNRGNRGRVFGLQQGMFNMGMGIGAVTSAYLYINLAHKPLFGLDGVFIIFLITAILSITGLAIIYIWLADTRKYLKSSPTQSSLNGVR